MNDDEKKLCAELWDKYEPMIRKMSNYKLQSSKSEIEDLIADVCLALCKKVHESGPPEKPKEWLIAVFNNLLNGKYKEIYAKRENETIYSDEEYDMPFRDNSIQQKEDEIFAAEILKKAEGTLKKDDYVIIDSSVIKDLKLKDIAANLNKTENAVKQKRYRVFQKLRKISENLEK